MPMNVSLYGNSTNSTSSCSIRVHGSWVVTMGPKPAAATTLPKVNAKTPTKTPAKASTTTAEKAGGGGSKAGGAPDKLPKIATPQKKDETESSEAVAPPGNDPSQPGASPAADALTPSTTAPQEGDTPNTTTTATAATNVPVATTATPKGPAKPVSAKPNGNVTLIYEQYNDLFPIENGSTTHDAIDDVYCLSFVMEGCIIHLSNHAPTVQREMVIAKKPHDDIYIYEDPRGTYHGLEADATYYVYVEQAAEALLRDQEMMKKKASTMPGAEKVLKDEYGNVLDGKGRVLESCSCKYGNPCSDAMYCDDWDNRCAVATKNGWKGF